MRLIPKLYLSFGTLLAIALASLAVAMWTAQRASFHLERTHFAHSQYELYLALSNNTFQLFKQFGDAIMIGDRDEGLMEGELISKIRGNIATLRRFTGEEIELVGGEEIEELDRLAAIERQINDLIGEYEALIQTSEPLELPTDWWRLSHVLDQRVDNDFNSLIEEAIADEQGEVAEAREETAARVEQLKIIAVLFSIIAVLATAGSLFVVVRDFRQPIENLLSAARALAEGNLSHRIDLQGKGELIDVGLAFNKMANELSTRQAALSHSKQQLEKSVADRTAELERVLNQLKANDENRRRLLADVSHELRTPLTIIQGEADIALRGQEKPIEHYQEALEKSREAAKHTAMIVDDLLFVARQEAGETKLKFGRIDLVKLIPDVVSETRSLADGTTSRTSFRCDLNEAVAPIDRDRIRQVIAILLENAFRYGAQQVDIALFSAPGGYSISVSDDGSGMVEEERSRAFERFFRGSNAASRYKEGSGLGLPVAKSIVEAHGGKIHLESSPGEGTVVSFTLPSRPRLEAAS